MNVETRDDNLINTMEAEVEVLRLTVADLKKHIEKNRLVTLRYEIALRRIASNDEHKKLAEIAERAIKGIIQEGEGD